MKTFRGEPVPKIFWSDATWQERLLWYVKTQHPTANIAGMPLETVQNLFGEEALQYAYSFISITEMDKYQNRMFGNGLDYATPKNFSNNDPYDKTNSMDIFWFVSYSNMVARSDATIQELLTHQLEQDDSILLPVQDSVLAGSLKKLFVSAKILFNEQSLPDTNPYVNNSEKLRIFARYHMLMLARFNAKGSWPIAAIEKRKVQNSAELDKLAAFLMPEPK